MLRSIRALINDGIRAALLERANTPNLRKFATRLPHGTMPSYIVVTPHLTHLAPLAAVNHPDFIQPVFVANGTSSADIDWLSRMCPDIPILRLKTSLHGNVVSLLAHGSIIDMIAMASDSSFCIQDADCFITDEAFWNSLQLDEERHYAAGPFLRKSTATDRPGYPETFLLMLNGQLMKRLRRLHGITAATSVKPNRRSRLVLEKAGYPSGEFLETLKAYYDTLQQYWVAASFYGYSYNHLQGEAQTVFHVGGTSYLYEDFGDLAHWDHWALNVQYFHLRMLELPACEPIRSRFAGLEKFHDSATRLLAHYPEFAKGLRRIQSDMLVEVAARMPSYSRRRSP